MCSDEGGPDPSTQSAAEPLAMLTQAIDDLAAANVDSLSLAELIGRVARAWALAGNVDPELARRAARYRAPGPRRRLTGDEQSRPDGSAT